MLLEVVHGVAVLLHRLSEAAVAQVCPLCRGAMPDAERLRVEVGRPSLSTAGGRRVSLVARHCRRRSRSGWARRWRAIAAEPQHTRLISPAAAHLNLANLLDDRGNKAGAEAAYRAAIAALDETKANLQIALRASLEEERREV